MHFSRGLELEAEVAARFVLDGATGTDGEAVVQFASTDLKGTLPAAALARVFAKSGRKLESSRTFASLDRLRAELARLADAGHSGVALVVWPGRFAADVSSVLAERPDIATRILLPSAAVQTATALPLALQERLCFIWPYELPGNRHPREYRVRAWMGARRVQLSHPRLQFEAYYALTLIQYGL